LRWSVLKRGDADHLTTNQLKALAELLDQGLDTATAWRIKERLDWIRLAKTPRAARWRITRFIGYARELIGDSDLLEPVRKALATLENHAERVVRRWTSTYTNARMEGLNSLFQAARARARGYRNNRTLYNYDLHDCQPGGFHTEIHMKRRRASFYHLKSPEFVVINLARI
ncbi:transposase, partial [Thiolapillus sp.]|uniref:transposase n=1 Tax=Thiolapillus sp. TaxID=2017437 RepID=UPI0035AC0F2E